MKTEEKKESRGTAFIRHALERMSKDNAFGAALKRADNPATEYQSWEYLAAYRVDLEKPFERIPFAYMAAAVARAKPAHDGSLGLGRAISTKTTRPSENCVVFLRANLRMKHAPSCGPS
jgi:CRISPR system Cascade subunit CasB